MKRCPWCQAELSVGQLCFLHWEPRSECKACGNPFRNTLARDAAAFILPLPLLYLAGSFWMPPLWLWLPAAVVTFQLSNVLLAEPVKAPYEEKACSRCERPDAAYRRPYHDICDDCLRREEASKTDAR